MLRITDASPPAGSIFQNGRFRPDRWETYMESVCPGAARLCREDMAEATASGKFTWEKDYLPVIEAVPGDGRLEELRASFAAVTKGLGRRVRERFGRELEADVILYLGLCSGAGWVVELNGRTIVLLGIEKILELGWHTRDALCGLLYHELGHIYHGQYGALNQESRKDGHRFVWQLFAEGVAMYFEQELAGEPGRFHQYDKDWAGWCGEHFVQLLRDFDRDLPSMRRDTQRYFGDWCDYHGRGDTGYYLGARFVRELAENIPFDTLVGLDTGRVWELYRDFVRRHARGRFRALFSKAGTRRAAEAVRMDFRAFSLRSIPKMFTSYPIVFCISLYYNKYNWLC
ncbi:MAG: hypothetical protein HFG26_05885 [Provencibacterium sp.]|nr:hypothetical protein [Provencibacterium sp.]